MYEIEVYAYIYVYTYMYMCTFIAKAVSEPNVGPTQHLRIAAAGLQLCVVLALPREPSALESTNIPQMI